MEVETPQPTEPIRAPNRLIVENPTNDDNSIAIMNEQKMKDLKIFNGDAVLLKGKRRRKTLCIAIRDPSLTDPQKIAINKVSRNNLRSKLGDIITVSPLPDVPNLQKIHVLPYADSIEGLTGNIAEIYLQPYFKDANRPLHVNTTFIVRGRFKPVEFKVVATEPGEFGIVSSETVLFTDGEPIVRKDED